MIELVLILFRAFLYWTLINLATLPSLLLFLRKYVLSNADRRVRVDIIEFLVPYQLGTFGAVAWAVFFAPFLEEILFFGVPAMLGFWYTVLGLISWTMVHISRTSYALRTIPDPVDRWGGLISYTLFILLHGWLSLWLWSIGWGVLSIALHSLHNAVVFLGLLVRPTRSKPKQRQSREKQHKQYWTKA